MSDIRYKALTWQLEDGSWFSHVVRRLPDGAPDEVLEGTDGSGFKTKDQALHAAASAAYRVLDVAPNREARRAMGIRA